MKSDATTVEDYIKQAPADRQEALIQLRTLCKNTLTGYQEKMTSTGPTYQKDKGMEIAFSSQKIHICFYCLVHEVMKANKDLLNGLNHGKGVIRFSNPAKINFEVIKKLLVATAGSDSLPC